MEEKKEIYGTAVDVIRGETRPNKYGFKAFEVDIVPRINPGASHRNCHLNCEGCYQALSGEMISLKKFNSLLREAMELKLGGCYLLGGEPTRHDNFFEIMAAIANTDLAEKILVSNCVDFSDIIFLEKLLNRGDFSDWLLVTKRWVLGNSLKEKTAFEKTAHQKGFFEKVQKAWANIMRYWPGKICLQACITEPLLDYIPEVYEWGIRQEKIVKVSIEMVRQGQGRRRSFPFGKKQKQDVSPEQLLGLFQKLTQIDRMHGIKNDNLIRAFCSPGYKLVCTLPFETLHINSTGDVIPCGGSPASYGNIHAQTLEEIMKSPKVSFFQSPKKWLVGPCSDCPEIDYCLGGCRGEAFRAFHEYGINCYRASNPYCVAHLLNGGAPRDYRRWVPSSCNGCPLKHEPTCHLSQSR